MNFSKKRMAAAMAVVFLVPTTSLATNGYFSHGYGVKSSSMGGAGVAHPQDSMAAATNPAGMVYVGNRVDLGAQLFNPNRENSHTGGDNTGTTESKNNLFLIPHVGYNTMLDSNTSLGVAVFGNGGMNTSYRRNNDTFGPANSKLGVDLAQLLITPTWARKIDNHAVGVSLVLAAQRFKASGLENFKPQSISPTNLTNNGYDISTGWGIRLGWIGEINDRVSLGVTYATKTYMSEFDDYKGLFAEQGDLDIPANYAVGIKVKATPKTTVAFDIMRIEYGSVRAIANKIDESVNLGTDDGRGFGWEDQTVYKLGIEHEYNKTWTFRGGLNYGEMPYDNTQMDFNIISPATVETHLTLGGTYSPNKENEIDFGYMHAFSNEITGQGQPAFNLGTITHKMDQNVFFMNYAWKF